MQLVYSTCTYTICIFKYSGPRHCTNFQSIHNMCVCVCRMSVCLFTDVYMYIHTTYLLYLEAQWAKALHKPRRLTQAPQQAQHDERPVASGSLSTVHHRVQTCIRAYDVSMCVCVCVCVCVCKYVYMHVCMYVVCMHACM